MHPTVQKATDYVQKTEREFLFVEGIQQTKFDTIISIDTTSANDPMRQQLLANITCSKCSQNGHYRKDCPSSAGTGPLPDKTS